MVNSPNNQLIKSSLVAVARRQFQYPGFDLSRARDVAARIDRVVAEDQQMHVTVALVVLLLKAMGVHLPADPSRFLAD